MKALKTLASSPACRTVHHTNARVSHSIQQGDERSQEVSLGLDQVRRNAFCTTGKTGKRLVRRRSHTLSDASWWRTGCVEGTRCSEAPAG
jgi:hypothetical protein